MPSKAMQSRSPGVGIHRIAAAKINLYLHITGRLEGGDHRGYHTLDSLVAFAAIGDVITVEPADAIKLRIEGPMAADLSGAGGAAEDNLVYRAACLLAQRGAVKTGAALTLKKHLPVAAGLGGGSADAAAALHALCAHWRLSIDAAELSRIGLELGADVPVCLAGQAALMSGIGERLNAFPALPEAYIVLVHPGVTLSTAKVFSALKMSPGRLRPLDGAFPEITDLVSALKQRGNDLERPATRLEPVIADVLAALAAHSECLLARMSGSGATCFGLFADETSAVNAADQIMLDQPGWWVAVTRLVGDTDKLQAWAA
jgi:4-diphosphocytidyl-2-C-methyl-D-erythritol kinase